MGELDFEVLESPVWYESNGAILKSDKHKALVHSKSNEALSIMSDSYNPLSITDFKEISNKLQKVSGFEFEQYQQFKNGRIVLSYLKNNTGLDKVGDFQLNTYLVLGNSFDGSNQIFLSNSSVVLRCQNQFSRLMKTKFKHTTSSQFKLNELVTSIGSYFEDKNRMLEEFNIWNNISITSDTVKLAIEKMVEWDSIEENSTRKINKATMLRDAMISETNAMGNNLWSVFNGFTKVNTHNIRPNEMVFGNVVGSGYRQNLKAFEIIKQLELYL